MSRLHTLRYHTNNAVHLACEHHDRDDNAFSLLCSDFKRIETELNETMPSFEHVRTLALTASRHARSFINVNPYADDVPLLIRLEEHAHELVGITAGVI